MKQLQLNFAFGPDRREKLICSMHGQRTFKHRGIDLSHRSVRYSQYLNLNNIRNADRCQCAQCQARISCSASASPLWKLLMDSKANSRQVSLRTSKLDAPVSFTTCWKKSETSRPLDMLVSSHVIPFVKFGVKAALEGSDRTSFSTLGDLEMGSLFFNATA